MKKDDILINVSGILAILGTILMTTALIAIHYEWAMTMLYTAAFTLIASLVLAGVADALGK